MKLLVQYLILPSIALGQCIPKEHFEFMVKGPCNYNNLVTSIQQSLNYPDPLEHTTIPCPHSAADEIDLHFPVNSSAVDLINDLCKVAVDTYYSDKKIPWSNVTLEEDKFDKEYYDGNGDWNEEHQSNYPHPLVIPGEASNVLRRDAERVDDLYETQMQRHPLQWPGDAPTSMSNFENCKLNSAMCCWVSDRQANDNNGNCATPYDERCLDADPADNTDLCAVDMARSGDSSHVEDGFALFFGNEEGPVHCHGLAWGMDEMEPDYRYRANNLFYVSMSDHLHDRGYVRAVQGAPMCGCVENMPIVSRSDCTEIHAIEFYKISFNTETGEPQASLDYVDLNFNACQASRNNNLERFYERLRNEGRVTHQMYHEFKKTVVGDNQCPSAINTLIFDKGHKYQAPDIEGWTMLYGRGANYSPNSNPDLWNSIDAGSYVRRICSSCSNNSHKDIIYKRLTSGGTIDFFDMFLHNWFSHPEGGSNIRGNHFQLYSNFEDAQYDDNPWKFCNYNDGGVGFPRDCGPNGRVNNEWNSMGGNGETDFAFYLYKDKAILCEENPLECGCMTRRQAEYRGTISMTGNDIACQRWDSQSPHSHNRTPQRYPTSGLEENYCRNPGLSERAWCYTTDPNVRWGYCNVPDCENTEQSLISVDKNEYTVGEDIMVSFENIDPTELDWIGLYPNGSGPFTLPRGSTMWLYACGTRSCSSVTSNGTVIFDAGDVLQDGEWQVFLLSNNGYVSKAYSDKFVVVAP